VTAPRVTLFNGQRAYVLVVRQQSYVSNLTPVVGAGVVSFAPTIDVVESGVKLDVQATVSSDRKYVTLTLRPQLSELIGLFNFTFQVGAAPNINNINNILGSGAPTGIIQQPEIQLTEVKTTVSVPDGGTLLLGGQTLSGETTREAGVPVLSKVPFLKRLFTNRSEAKDETVVLILVKPTIIIQREAEQKQFPLLSTKSN
jgi:type II secretory pathway component GspD/PulD (secretin)